MNQPKVQLRKSKREGRNIPQSHQNQYTIYVTRLLHVMIVSAHDVEAGGPTRPQHDPRNHTHYTRLPCLNI
eukprot:SAG11_NODE_1409_length_4997_cov_4.521846_3_plen_71_part_00